MSKLTAVIIDDASQARRLLSLMLDAIAPDVEIIGEASTAAEGNAIVQKMRPDVVFLDIEMPGKSGVQLAGEWAKNKTEVNIIFTTAYQEYAVTAFRLSAMDYLLKPINELHLAEALNRVRTVRKGDQQHLALQQLVDNLHGEKEKTITIPVTGGFEFLRLDEIFRIEADGSYARIIRKGGKTLTVAKNLKYFETALAAEPRFMRVHRSFIVNLDHVRKFAGSGRMAVVMSDGAEVDVAREKKDVLLDRFSGQ